MRANRSARNVRAVSLATGRVIFCLRLLACAGAVGLAINRTNARTIDINPDSVCAIAYSPSTGEYHYGYGFSTRKAAEQAALKMCTAPDSQIVCWVKDGFAALALGDDKTVWGTGWKYGPRANNLDTGQMAIDECAKRTAHADVALLVSSDGQFFYDRKKAPPPDSGSPGGGGAPSSASPRPSASPVGFISQMFSGEVPLPHGKP